MVPEKIMKVSVFFLLLISLSGCSQSLSTASYSSLSPVSNDKDVAKVSVYLNTFGDCSGHASFTLTSLEIYNGQEWLRLELKPVFVERQQVLNRQQMLGLVGLPPGDYQKARLHLSGIEQEESGSKEGVTLTLQISRDFNLSRNDSKCLFLNWHLDDCSSTSTHALPRFSVQGQTLSVSGETLYVVSDDIKTLYFIRSDTHFVVASMGFPSRLGDVRYDKVRQQLYLLSPMSRTIYVVDEVNNQTIDRIPLPSLIQPTFLDLSADGDFAYVTDPSTDRVVKVDLFRRTVVAEATVGVSPERILFFEDSGRNLLAISSKTTPQVFIVNTDNLALVTTLSADINPGDLFFNDGLLYVNDQGSNVVIAYDLNESRMLGRINVGSRPISLADDGRDQIFVGHDSETYLSVIAPGQFAVQRRIPVGHNTFDLAYLNSRQMLYAAHRNSRKISVIDLSLEKKIQEIALGGTPFSIDVQE